MKMNEKQNQQPNEKRKKSANEKEFMKLTKLLLSIFLTHFIFDHYVSKYLLLSPTTKLH